MRAYFDSGCFGFSTTFLTSPFIIFATPYLSGFIYGEHVSFFEKDEKIFYKRSPYILTIWIAGFLARILLEFLYPDSKYIWRSFIENFSILLKK